MAQAEKTWHLQLKEALTDQATIHGEERDKEALREDFIKVIKAEEERALSAVRLRHVESSRRLRDGT